MDKLDTWVSIPVSKAAVATTAIISSEPENADLNIFIGRPTAALNENAVIGPSKGEISIAPIIMAGLSEYNPTNATTDAITIMIRRSFLNFTKGSVKGINSSYRGIFFGFWTFSFNLSR